MDNVVDDLTFYGPTRAGDGWEINQVLRCSESQNWLAPIKVYEQLPGPQCLT